LRGCWWWERDRKKEKERGYTEGAEDTESTEKRKEKEDKSEKKTQRRKVHRGFAEKRGRGWGLDSERSGRESRGLVVGLGRMSGVSRQRRRLVL
jgi:hypothetical protein